MNGGLGGGILFDYYVDFASWVDFGILDSIQNSICASQKSVDQKKKAAQCLITHKFGACTYYM